MNTNRDKIMAADILNKHRLIWRIQNIPRRSSELVRFKLIPFDLVTQAYDPVNVHWWAYNEHIRNIPEVTNPNIDKEQYKEHFILTINGVYEFLIDDTGVMWCGSLRSVIQSIIIARDADIPISQLLLIEEL